MAKLSEGEQLLWNGLAADLSSGIGRQGASLVAADSHFCGYWERHSNPRLTADGSEELVAALRLRRPRARGFTPRVPAPRITVAPPAAGERLELPPYVAEGQKARASDQGPAHRPPHHRRRRMLSEGRWRSLAAVLAATVAGGVLGVAITGEGRTPAGFTRAEQVVLGDPKYLGQLGLCKQILTEAASNASAASHNAQSQQLSFAASLVSSDAPCALPPESSGVVWLQTGVGNYAPVHGTDLVGPLAPTAHVTASPAPAPSLPASVAPTPTSS